MATQRPRTRTNTSKSSQLTKFKFHWWMAVILVVIVAFIGIAILRFSHAGTAKPLYYSTFTGSVAPANNNIYKLDASLPAAKLTNTTTTYNSSRGNLCHPSTNAKGDLVYVSGLLNSNLSSIWISSNGKNTQLTNTVGVSDMHPQWSGDGSKIYFIRDYTGNSSLGTLMEMNLDGTNLHKYSQTGLDKVETYDVNPLILGELVVQNSPSVDVYENLLIDPSGNVLTKISTNGNNGLVCFANNGGSIVFQNDSNTSNVISIAVLNTMKNGPAKVSTIAGGVMLIAGFSPDSSSILVQKNVTTLPGQIQRNLVKIDVSTKQQNIVLSNISSSTILWNPNLANNIVFVAPAPNATSPNDTVHTSIYSINADGTNKQIITTVNNISNASF